MTKYLDLGDLGHECQLEYIQDNAVMDILFYQQQLLGKQIDISFLWFNGLSSGSL